MTQFEHDLIYNYMESCMRRDSAHDQNHVIRVLNLALSIAQGESGVNMDVLIATCLLHDIGRPEQNADPKLCHAQVGAQKTRQFLLDNGFDEAFAQHVTECVKTHRFRTDAPPDSLEAKILFDADKLDVTGAIGVARTFMYQGHHRHALYHLMPSGEVDDGSRGNVNDFFNEYKRKLEGIYDRFYTRGAAAIAASRKEAMESYYNALLQEAQFAHDNSSLSKFIK